MKVISLKVGDGIYTVEATATKCGQDYNICIGGGDTYHIGAVALGIPRASLADPTRVSASASVLCVTSHKEDEAAREAALRFATLLNRRVVVSCGLHIDNADSAAIKALYDNYLQILALLDTELVK